MSYRTKYHQGRTVFHRTNPSRGGGQCPIGQNVKDGQYSIGQILAGVGDSDTVSYRTKYKGRTVFHRTNPSRGRVQCPVRQSLQGRTVFHRTNPSRGWGRGQCPIGQNIRGGQCSIGQILAGVGDSVLPDKIPSGKYSIPSDKS